MKARHDGSSGAPGPAGGPIPRGHRSVGSLLLLALPTGHRRGALGLYVTFPQQLPRLLLQQAQTSLMELLQVLCPLVARKLGGDLSLELETLATATPGSYAVPRRKPAFRPAAQSGFGSQLPLLVASLQDSISSARLRTAAATAAAASAGRSPSQSRTRNGAPSPSVLHSLRTASAGMEVVAATSSGGHGGSAGTGGRGTGSGFTSAGLTGDASSSICGGALTELAQLRLGRRLGHGGCAVVFKARLGTQDCAVKVYTTFSPVALGVEQQPDGSETIALKPADGTEKDRGSDAPPLCIAIVCEWCDRGSLAGALANKALTRVVPAAKVSGPQAKEGQREVRVLDVRAIMMTLLDVAMALRHLHSLNLIHRDLKPANVLLKTCPTDPRGFTAKLADFGYVTLLNQPGDEENGFMPYAIVDEVAGTEMTVCGARPYPEVDPGDILDCVKAGQRPAFHNAVPLPYRSLAQRCWSADPHQRPRTPELVVAISGLLRSMA
ncbi:hypothetical protein GPECTOR_85g349 [Gonium pectorale]|uniref:Protein kinase domain-containing protein n=1 Tax=Gonium pectorale TaxID=33097 RepID=A0A150G175_GONPE|nr:hypothetical protein GPECTOR_85g349 [Gonium pectorale]|eukprot:KXZ43619.1 hypothetical protein GPECTOR_85g349 [Gonium pectorale]